MTDPKPLTEDELGDIETRAAHLHEYATLAVEHGPDAQPAAERVIGTDVPALVAEVRRLRAELVREERLHGDTIDDRDRAQDAADKLSYAVASEEAIGEHSSGNCPWWNALDLITPAAEVDKLRARVAELEGPAVEARAALAALCYDLEDPGSDALGALYLLQQATLTVDAPKDDTSAALLRHACKVLHGVADIADPEPPEVSFFGGVVGPQVAAWLRMLADQPAAAAVVSSATETPRSGR